MSGQTVWGVAMPLKEAGSAWSAELSASGVAREIEEALRVFDLSFR